MTGPEVAKAPEEPARDRPARWDIAVAALACVGLTTAFIQIWPQVWSSPTAGAGAVGGPAPTGALLVKAALASLGFVAIAVQWERAVRLVFQDPSFLILMCLAFVSALWAVSPAETVRDGLLFVLVWCFGLALALRFATRDLAEIFAFAGLFSVAILIVQPGAQAGMASLSLSREVLAASAGDLAFALTAFGWAAYAVPARRNLWLTFLALGLLAAWRGGDLATLGAVCGACLGAGIMLVASAMRKGGGSSLIAVAWLVVAAIAVMTAFALFGAASAANAIDALMGILDASWAIGNGFGSGGPHLAGAIGEGLGIAGLIAALLVATTGFVRVLWASRSLSATPIVWMAMLGAVVCAPHHVAVSGPCILLLVSAGFALSTVQQSSRGRRPLVGSKPARMDPFVEISSQAMQRPARGAGMETASTASVMQVKGLRPRL
jgi:hypothetical protein